MKKPLITLNLYIPTFEKKKEIVKKAKASNKSISQFVIEAIDAFPIVKK